MRKALCIIVFLCVGGLFLPGYMYGAEQPIVIGAPLATAFLYGWDAERGIKLAADEINAAGGVKVGPVKRPFKVEVIDTRDLEPGVPVSEALLGLEKLILEKKADFIIGGPVRSEAALAAMDILSKYKKVSIITTGVLTPAYQKKIESNYSKYKYCFRNTSHVGVMMGEFVTLLEDMKKSYGFNTAIRGGPFSHRRSILRVPRTILSGFPMRPKRAPRYFFSGWICPRARSFSSNGLT
jgi:branched-chain amino acid transport system substrate-binding protein